MPGNKPVILLVKLPFAAPSLVCESVIEGLCEVLQQIPLPVTADPPSDIIFPPDAAEVRVMMEAPVVVSVGTVASVVKVKSLPYAVPALFVA